MTSSSLSAMKLVIRSFVHLFSRENIFVSFECRKGFLPKKKERKKERESNKKKISFFVLTNISATSAVAKIIRLILNISK
jgi:hypothetical protein